MLAREAIVGENGSVMAYSYADDIRTSLEALPRLA